jgi:hypothetical protein
MKRIHLTWTLLALTFFMSCECESRSVRAFAFKAADRQEQVTDSFNAIELEGNFEVYLFNGDQHKVVLEGDEDVLEWVVLNVVDDVLKITYLNDKVVKKSQSVILEITVKDLREFSSVSALKLVTPNVFSFEKLVFDLAGAVSMELNLEGHELEAYCAGASSIKAQGKVKSAKFELPGAGKLEGFDLKAEKVVLILAGAGKAEVYATEALQAEIAGACSVVYQGDPENVYSNVSGIGRVKRAD